MNNKILESIHSITDLKKLNFTQLKELAKEIREVIIDTCSEYGGHLAPNLCTVELTLALHYVFDTPNDKIIFDVGHQCYTHKLITGRYNKFNKLRQYQGLSGFPDPTESEYDTFYTGHGSTSISLAVGLAKANELKNTNNRVIALIGDGSLTGGMAFEGLNYAGSTKSNIIVILNDNEMFISKSVGALSNYLSKIRVSKLYTTARADFKRSIEILPKVGPRLFKGIKKIKDSIKYLFIPGSLFEDLGFNYVGPIDGHDIEILIRTLQFIKTIKGPVFLHVLTTKGKGFKLAEKDPTRFHGIAPFDKTTGKPKKSEKIPTYTEVFANTICKLGKINKDIVCITAAMKEGTGLYKFAKEYPQRFFDVGMAEQHAVTFAAGLCKQGLKPVVCIYSTFLQRAYDQLIHDVCLQNLPIIFCLDRAGIVGEDGPTHQGIFDLSYLSHMPNMVVASPADENELQHMLNTAINYGRGPFAIRYPRGEGEGIELDTELKIIDVPQAEIITETEADKLVIIAIGRMVNIAKEVAYELRKENINVCVINARFIKPLDEELLLQKCKDINCVITIEENIIKGGFGEAVLELLVRNNIQPNIKLIGLPNKFIEVGSPHILLQKYGLSKENIIKVVKELVIRDKR